MKRGKKSHYAATKAGKARCGANVPSFRVGPRGKATVTCKRCTSIDRSMRNGNGPRMHV
jgi:hypothetical protein